jgi:peroxiredoxin Q/BCP
MPFRRSPLPFLCALAGAWNLFAAPTDFTVEAPADGRKFRLAEAKGKYVALHFLLKTECPLCLRHTRDYAQRGETLPEVVSVFLKPDSADEIKSWADKLGKPAAKEVTLYRDADATLAKAFAIPDGYPFHGQSVHFPALVLLDPAGQEVFRHVGKNNGDRFGFDLLVAKLAELKATAAKRTPAPLAHYNLAAGQLALQGYDPVAYFTAGQPNQGQAEFTAAHRGVNYRFASAANRKQFLASPDKYVPTYGGWCATAMAKGEKVEIDPGNFKLTNGRLLLFYKGLWGNARKDWDQDEPAQTAKADAHWKQLSNE